MRKPTMLFPTLCHGSMRAGLRAAGVAPPAPPLVSCVLCGRAFAPITAHTSQVPRHRPRVTMHRRRWFRPTAWHTLVPVGVVGELATAVPALAVSPKLPPWIPVGDWILDRVPGDFPDDVVFSASVGAYTLWVKSPNLLDGPWDWIIEEGRSPIHLGGPFASRELATADLLDVATSAGIPTGPAELNDLVSVAAATDEPVRAPPHGPTARDPVPSCSAHVASAAGHGTVETDPEILGLALDLAIATLRRARAHLPARIAA